MQELGRRAARGRAPSSGAALLRGSAVQRPDPPLRSLTVLTAAAATPVFTVSLASALTIAGAVLAVFDSAWRFRRPGGNALLAILVLVLGLLLLVAGFPPVRQYVSTSIPVLYLAAALTVVLLVELLVKSARKGGVLWLTIVATLVTGAAAVVAFLKVG